MAILKNIAERTKAFISVFLLLLQSITVAAFTGLVNSRDNFKEISSNIFPDSTVLMNNSLLEYMLSLPVLLLLIAVFVVSLLKELILKNRRHKVLINIGILSIMCCIFIVVSYFLYSPIISYG